MGTHPPWDKPMSEILSYPTLESLTEAIEAYQRDTQRRVEICTPDGTGAFRVLDGTWQTRSCPDGAWRRPSGMRSHDEEWFNFDTFKVFTGRAAGAGGSLDTHEIPSSHRSTPQALWKFACAVWARYGGVDFSEFIERG